MTPDIETLVIGAGAVGLAIAKFLSAAGQEVLVLERNERIGMETSARNSEVIHAGIYYPKGSLKARLCIEGKQRLYRFCEENGVVAKRCGKLIVACEEAERAKLEQTLASGRANGLEDLKLLSAQEARALEPALSCIEACLSPSTGVVDSHGYLQALEGHITSSGGSIVLNSEVVALERTSWGGYLLMVRSPEGEIALTCRRLVSAAGLGGATLGRFLSFSDGYKVPNSYPAKGHYYQLEGKSPFSRLIYPLPQGAWLGVHLTLDYTGKAKFGPDLEWIEELDYSFDDPSGERQARFEAEIRRYWPGLPDEALQPDYTGIRPKIYRQGEAAPDFQIHGPQQHGLDNFIALYGIESPGLTSSLGIGAYVAELLSA